MRISNSDKGVTVLELLLTIAISAIIFAAIYGVFVSGLKVWEVETARSLVQQDADFTMNRIERELKKASNITMALDTAIEFGIFPANSPQVDSCTVSLWHFNDGSGSNAVDAAGNNNASLGQGSGSPVWTVNGEDSAALNFDGSNDYVGCGNGATLNITSRLELEVWVRPNSSSAANAIFCKNGAYKLCIDSSNKLVGSIYYSGVWHDAVSSSDIVRNGSTWTHTALSYDKDEGGIEELKVYINGVIEGTSDNSGFIDVSSNSLYIGRDQDNKQCAFDGCIDEARISNNVRRTRISRDGLEISYYDTAYNLLAVPGGTDTQAKRNTIKSVKVSSLGLENAVALKLNTKGPCSAIINKGTPFNFDVSLGREPSLSPIDSTNYLVAYVGPANAGMAVVLTADTDSKTVTCGAPFTFDASAASCPDLSQINTGDYLLVYSGAGNDGWSAILTVNTVARTITKSSTFEFDTNTGITPAVIKIDSANYLVAYNGSGSDGWSVILTVDPVTKAITKSAAFEFDADNGVSPAAAQIDSTNYLVVYEGKNSDGWSIILTVNTVVKTITKGTPFEFDIANGSVPAIIKIDSTNYLVAYQGSGGNGVAVILTVNVATGAITKGTPFIFESGSCTANSLEQIDTVNYLLTYSGPVNTGRSVILTVDTTAKTVTQGNMFIFDNTGYEPDVTRIDAANYPVVYRGGPGNSGWSVILYLPQHLSGGSAPYVYKWEEIFE